MRRNILLATLLASGWLAVAGGQERIPPGLSDASELPAPPGAGAPPPPPGLPQMGQEPVVDVRIEGNKNVSLQKIAPHIRTRAGRPFDLEIVEEDVRRLNKSRLFISVDTSYQRVPEGLVVVFRVVERPILKYVKYVGSTIKTRHLAKKSGLKVGDAMDPYAIEEGKRKLEEYYLSKGFSKATVTVIEGNKATDAGAVFLINEGRKQKISQVRFVGNTVATDARMKTQIQSKPPILYVFKGEVDRQKIDEDVERLTAYYRSLGYFRARIGRELEFNAKQNWLTLTFVIDEGPRYVVRNVSFIGNSKFKTDELSDGLKLKGEQYFNQAAMTKDVSLIQDKYGSQGYIFADVQADPRFLEEPGELDLVYQIEEGSRYRVGRINVKILGKDPRTRRNTVLNRISLRPGDIVDTRQLRASERRLKASGLFLNDPSQGVEPKLVIRQPDAEEDREAVAGGPKGFRGQSPDGEEGERKIDLDFFGHLTPEADEADEERPATRVEPPDFVRPPVWGMPARAFFPAAPPAARGGP